MDIPFPWHLGVYDAHCHATDTMASIGEVVRMKTAALTLMATRGQDQELVAQAASTYAPAAHSDSDSDSVDQRKPRIIPSFGWHPWFSHQIIDDINSETRHDTPFSKVEHYKGVLTPPTKDEGLLHALPEPFPLSKLIADTKARLHQHPHGLVGEIGLDRSFRIPNAWLPHELEKRDASLTPGSREGRSLSPHRVALAHQREIFKAQLRLAGSMQRPVSVHSVQAHGAVLEVLQELWSGHERKRVSNRQRKRRPSADKAHEHSDHEKDRENENDPQTPAASSLPFPLRICMHSYSGPPDVLKQFLQKSNPAETYFSFSSVINFAGGSSEKTVEVIKALPEDRILVESDLHCAGKRMDELMEAIVRQVCSIRGWDLEYGIRILGENWTRFVFG
ncbi:Cut9-interacting protein scn1 [Paracoccidioides lutzii Pb01]|uniref:Cut9-interacting protein scn1 n=1 Tax=Paracoccidioides lutzii (strain ATCC MYA-826 / Pb01) TaxID=502779 RepID=C1GNX9_PARBA|nr:Cut9-interacting protein scn1 [Paracoccidioides lutzii Pb01]EEH35901.2 Cut9-interacting protein scn1 [Paracoccidioides lutzii Pb01]